MRDLNVINRSVSALRPYKRNARTHSKKQIRQIADSIEVFGFTNPVLTDGHDRIIAGHARIAAARLLGIGTVPTIAIDDLSEAQVRAYTLADNKLAENAGWDTDLLAIELKDLSEAQIEFDVTVTGFGMPEIDLLIGALDCASAVDSADSVPPIDDGAPAVTKPAQLWRLGPHRLLCGDATHGASFTRLMEGHQAQLVFTDPPYNVSIDRNVCGLGKVKHREFAMASGEMSTDEFTTFLGTVFGHLGVHSADGAIHFICMDWRHIGEILDASKRVYSDLKNLCIWNKTNGGMGSLYRSKHELVFVFKKGEGPHINNVELGKHGRYRTNVWDYAGINTFGKNRLDELALHPTVKPVALVADAIRDCSNRGGIVLDCFAGSGTTLIAAERTGRRCLAMELDPHYVDAAIERLRQVTGEEAIDDETGLTFSQMRDWRDLEGEMGSANDNEQEKEVANGR